MKKNYIYKISDQFNKLNVTFAISDIICMELNSEKNFFAISFSSGKDYIIGNNFSIDFNRIITLYEEINKDFIEFKSDESNIYSTHLNVRQL